MIEKAGMLSYLDILNLIEEGHICITPFYLPKTIRKSADINEDEKSHPDINEDEKSHPDINEDEKSHCHLLNLCEHTERNNAENDKRLTPAGFNFSFTHFIVSLNSGSYIQVYEDTVNNDIFFELASGDTALALTQESIWVSGYIAGTFHSKVSFVAQGLGHISTTLDPGWNGQLLISINNPNKEDKRVVIGKKNNRTNEIDYSTFITLCLYKLCTPALKCSDNTFARFEIIERILRSKPCKLEDESICNRNETIANGIAELKTEVLGFKQNKGLGLDCSQILNIAKMKIFSEENKLILSRLDNLFPKITCKMKSENVVD